MTDWRWREDGPVLVATSVLTGEFVRAEPVGAVVPVAWARSENMPAALRNVVEISAFAFERAHPMNSIEPPSDVLSKTPRRGQVIVETRSLTGGALCREFQPRL